MGCEGMRGVDQSVVQARRWTLMQLAIERGGHMLFFPAEILKGRRRYSDSDWIGLDPV